MKRRSILSIVLVSCMILTMVLPVGAQEVVIGTDEDITGYLVPDEYEESQKERGGSYDDLFDGGNPRVLIFSITAAQVTQLLTSNAGNKSFQVESLPSEAKRLIIQANLNHSLQNESGITGNLNECVIAGLCYYGYSAQIGGYGYISVASANVPQGQFGQTYTFDFMIDDVLTSGVTYYTYVKNTYPSGYVYGSVQLYYDIS